MNRETASILVVSVIAALALAACGDDASDGGDSEVVEFTGSDGAELYAQACATCHGADLTGTDKGPPFLDAIYRPGHHADPAFFLAAKRGARAHHWNFGDMPPVEGISDQQIDAIVAFVRTRQREAGIE